MREVVFRCCWYWYPHRAENRRRSGLLRLWQREPAPVPDLAVPRGSERVQDAQPVSGAAQGVRRVSGEAQAEMSAQAAALFAQQERDAAEWSLAEFAGA